MPSGPCLTRAAGADDIPRLAELHREHLVYHQQFDPRYHARALSSLEHDYRQHLLDPGARVHVAVVGGEVVAFSLSRLYAGEPQPQPGWFGRLRRRPASVEAPSYGVIVDFFVAESHRRTGVGTLLLRAALDWLIAGGAREAQLGVAAGNHAGLGFWEAMGFGVYRVQMRRELKSP
ncbi:MAG: GNAT family N-acetyltransferase [Armatimonadetes bacterium]|nr:GNAT family N-acetyltransferase [Armatimonadota bacterium]